MGGYKKDKILRVRRSAIKGLFTWRWESRGSWGDLLRWGNPPVHIISHMVTPPIMWTCSNQNDYMDRQVYPMHRGGFPPLPAPPPRPHLDVNLPWEETTVNRHGLITSSSWSKRRGRLALTATVCSRNAMHVSSTRVLGSYPLLGCRWLPKTLVTLSIGILESQCKIAVDRRWEMNAQWVLHSPSMCCQYAFPCR